LPQALTWLLLILTGGAVGAYSTLIGAGGGFLLTPLLILAYPGRTAEVITAMSLGVVFMNAISGSIAYRRQRRIDYLAAAIFASTSVPGAVLGASLTALLPRNVFEAAFGVFLLCIALWLVLQKPSRIVTRPRGRSQIQRLHTDAQGHTYSYAFNPLHGALTGLLVGFLSSLFGVGGGLIFTPVAIMLMRFPAYIATATSTFTQVFAAGAGTTVHLLAGNYSGVWTEELSLIAGVLGGAQLGAFLSVRLAEKQGVIIRLLSSALGLVSVRLVVGAFV
jgi:uncharacterized membrane protein YfcA